MIKANFKTYASYITDSVYQWEVNRTLSVTGLNVETTPEVHFSNANMEKAIARQALLSQTGAFTVAIPNSILQDPLTIDAHVGIYEDGEFRVIEKISIPVIPRKRPLDYSFDVSDYEVYSFNEMDNKVTNALIAFNKAKGEYDKATQLINEFKDNKENKAEISKKTMSASKWSSNNTYSFETDYPVAEYNIEIALDNSATADQASAFNSAKIVGSATTNIVKAYGEIPTVSIPIIVKAVRV